MCKELSTHEPTEPLTQEKEEEQEEFSVFSLIRQKVNEGYNDTDEVDNV